LLDWIREWLSNRTQRVVINKSYSDWVAVKSGVPQGSVLGPLLFNIFINDLDDCVKASQIIKKFADDTKVAQVLENQDSAAELQTTLNELCAWATRWGMQFNVAKCHVMHVGRHNPRSAYTMNGLQLATTACEKDVGVMISDKLKPSAQCQQAAMTANRVLGQIQRAFHYRDRHTYIKLYAQYVRPHLEFAAPAWVPWTAGDITCLEKVQERALKAVSGLHGRDYRARLDELKMPTLEERRREADMVLTYKIMSDSDKMFSEQWFSRAAAGRATRQASGLLNLVPKRGHHEYRREFFSHRVIEPWNRLPDNIKAAKTAGAFKTRYRLHMETRVPRTTV
jgi:ribonucleases P/MRP protein subunit RPP40